MMRDNTYSITYVFNDRDSNSATMRVRVPIVFGTFAQIGTLALQIHNAALAICDGIISEYTITRSYTNASATSPSPGSDNSRLGVVCVYLVDNNMTVLLLPSIRESLVLTDTSGKSTYIISPIVPEMIALSAYIPSATDEYGTPMASIAIAGVSQ